MHLSKLVLAALLLHPSLASAAGLAVSFAPDRQVAAAEVAPFQTFAFHVLATSPSGGLGGYEFRLEPPAQLTVTGRTPMPEGSAINVGQGSDNWVVGTGQCLSGSNPLLLVRYEGMVLNDSGARFALGMSEPSSTGTGPAWVPCDLSRVEDFSPVQGAVLNAGKLSVGELKAELAN